MHLLLNSSSSAAKLALFKLALLRGCQINSSRVHLLNLSLKCCITCLCIFVLLPLPYVADTDLVWPASGSIWLKMLPSSMAFSHPALRRSEGRVIGGLTEFPWLGAYLNNLLVWKVSRSSLLFLTLLKHRKRFWIAFFSQVVLKITFPAYFEGFHFLCEFWNSAA